MRVDGAEGPTATMHVDRDRAERLFAREVETTAQLARAKIDDDVPGCHRRGAFAPRYRRFVGLLSGFRDWHSLEVDGRSGAKAFQNDLHLRIGRCTHENV